MQVNEESEQDLYRIGAVAKLTGISVERLRAWERRYAFVPANRSGKTRFYSSAQVARLHKIKQLIDQGHSISSVVDLSDDLLDARLSIEPEVEAAESCTVGLIGPNLLVLEQTSKGSGQLVVQARWANMDLFYADDLETTGELDVLIAQMPVLATETANFLEKRLPDTRLILLYQFATKQQIQAFEETSPHTLVKWPATWASIEHACLGTSVAPLRAKRSAPRKFSDEDLIAIAAASTDDTQLPANLVELIVQLNSLSEFTLDCADQVAELQLPTPIKSSARYEQLHRDVTHARAQLETALDTFNGEQRDVEPLA